MAFRVIHESHKLQEAQVLLEVLILQGYRDLSKHHLKGRNGSEGLTLVPTTNWKYSTFLSLCGVLETLAFICPPVVLEGPASSEAKWDFVVGLVMGCSWQTPRLIIRQFIHVGGISTTSEVDCNYVIMGSFNPVGGVLERPDKPWMCPWWDIIGRRAWHRPTTENFLPSGLRTPRDPRGRAVASHRGAGFWYLLLETRKIFDVKALALGSGWHCFRCWAWARKGPEWISAQLKF